MATRKTASEKSTAKEVVPVNFTTRTAQNGVDLLQFDHKLHNGRIVTVEALKNPKDFSIKMVLHTKRKDYIEFMFGALTEDSWLALEQAGAKIDDFEDLCMAYGEVIEQAFDGGEDVEEDSGEEIVDAEEV